VPGQHRNLDHVNPQEKKQIETLEASARKWLASRQRT
jgi:hypothetical protein